MYVPSAYQHADFLTKALTREAVEFHRGIVMNIWSEGLVVFYMLFLFRTVWVENGLNVFLR